MDWQSTLPVNEIPECFQNVRKSLNVVYRKIFMYVQECIFVCLYVCMYVCMYMYSCLYIWCMYVYMYVCVCVFNISDWIVSTERLANESFEGIQREAVESRQSDCGLKFLYVM
jgi:ABC-type transport system involved in Fe-S cluster assembly fused permease/ATPase subunit